MGEAAGAPRAAFAVVRSSQADCFAGGGTFLKEEFITKVTCQQISATSLPSQRWNQLKVVKKNCHMHGLFSLFFFFSLSAISI